MREFLVLPFKMEVERRAYRTRVLSLSEGLLPVGELLR